MTISPAIHKIFHLDRKFFAEFFLSNYVRLIHISPNFICGSSAMRYIREKMHPNFALNIDSMRKTGCVSNGIWIVEVGWIFDKIREFNLYKLYSGREIAVVKNVMNYVRFLGENKIGINILVLLSISLSFSIFAFRSECKFAFTHFHTHTNVCVHSSKHTFTYMFSHLLHIIIVVYIVCAHTFHTHTQTYLFEVVTACMQADDV